MPKRVDGTIPNVRADDILTDVTSGPQPQGSHSEGRWKGTQSLHMHWLLCGGGCVYYILYLEPE